MPLIEVTIGGFQSFREPVTVDLDPHVTLIAGPNDVGKSALLRALRLATEAQPGFGETPIVLRHVWNIPRDEFRQALQPLWQREVPQPQEVRRLVQAVESGDEVQTVEVEFQHPGAADPDTAMGLNDLLPASVSVPTLDARPSTSQPEYWESGPAAGTLYGTRDVKDLGRRRASMVYFILPRRPTPGPQQLVQTTRLLPSAENLTSVVAMLQLSDRTGKFAELEGFIRRAFPAVASIGLLPRGSEGSALAGELQIEYVYGPKVPLAQCGTGIEQMIALGTAILLHDEPRLILIDEPSSFLHPAAERVLIDFLREHREHQYVIATHSIVFLNAFPITVARLLSKDESGQTMVTTATAPSVLEAVGLRAGDLWLNRRRVWVEGASEVAAAMALAGAGAIDRDEVGLVRALPNHSRLLSRTSAQVEMVNAIAESVSSLPTEQWFVFDSDERGEAERARISDAADGKIVFLTVRELENCFLHPGVIAERLRTITESSHPSDEDVETLTDELIGRTSDPKLYPPGSEADAGRVRGSQVLDEIYWKLAKTTYDKVVEAPLLASLVLERAPGLLEPFLDALTATSS